uniref:uncharacterized protein LOC106674818 n=1 Tax=Maylandia zebra TaxID=106582 RepID=UPI000D30C753|nr:uncharacterized protein LOC106674818 [Maylandia zebra]
MTTFRQYCEAILILQHGLTGNAVQELCVEDWMARKAVADGVELSGNLKITSQEEQLLDCYFRNIRPVSLQNQIAGSDDRGKFFLGECGVPLSNPSLDVKRLKASYRRTINRRRRAAPKRRKNERAHHLLPQKAIEYHHVKCHFFLGGGAFFPIQIAWFNMLCFVEVLCVSINSLYLHSTALTYIFPVTADYHGAYSFQLRL